MRTFFTIAITTVMALFSTSLYAQHTANIDFYEGTWKYTNSQTGEEFTLQLRKAFNSVTSSWCVVGAYTYKKNGTIVTDCMNKYLLPIKENEMPVYATNSSSNPNNVNPNRLGMFIVDYGRFSPNGTPKSTLDNVLEIVSSTTPYKIRWKIQNSEGEQVYFSTTEIPPSDFSIPTDIVLTKQ